MRHCWAERIAREIDLRDDTHTRCARAEGRGSWRFQGPPDAGLGAASEPTEGIPECRTGGGGRRSADLLEQRHDDGAPEGEEYVAHRVGNTVSERGDGTFRGFLD